MRLISGLTSKIKEQSGMYKLESVLDMMELTLKGTSIIPENSDINYKY